MGKLPLLTTGLQGLVGSKLAAEFADRYEFISLDVHDPIHPVDITDANAVAQAFAQTSAEYVVHFAAYTDVTGAWQQQGDTSGIAYQVNVVGTQNIVQAAAHTGKHVIHISTAYVFDGQKHEPYLESDTPHPIEWYGTTKLLAEEAVQSSPGKWTILRIDQPFRSDSFAKPDAVRKIIQRAQDNPQASFFSDHWFGPTFIDDFVKVIDWVLRTGTTGLFHASNGEQWTDYDFAQLISQTLNLNLQFTQGSLATYLQSSQRPYQVNTSLNCEKLTQLLDFPLHSVAQAISKIQLS